MKRVSLLLALLLLFLLPTGCTQQDLESDSYMYGVVGKRLMRYNLRTGRGSVACPEPSCTHTLRDCPVTMVGDVCFQFGEHLIFINKFQQLCDYDLAANSIKGITEKSGDSHANDLVMGNGCMYYTFVQYEPDETRPEVGVPYQEIFRYNTESDQAEKLNHKKIETLDSLIDVEEDRLVWKSPETGETYSTDMDYQDKQPCDFSGETFVGDHALSRQNSRQAGDHTLSDFYMKQKDGSSKLVVEGALDARIAGDRVVYLLPREEAKDVTPEDVRDIVESPSLYTIDNRIYCMDLDGENKRVLCTLPDDCYIEMLNGFSPDELLVGDYLGIRMQTYTGTPYGEFAVSVDQASDIVLVNVQTGDWKITETEVEPVLQPGQDGWVITFEE